MTIPLGGDKINPSPCTEEDMRQNWQQVAQTFVDIYETFDAGGTDDHKVQTNADDVSPTYDGPDYLYPKLYHQSTWDGDLHQPVYAEVYDDAGALKVRLFTVKTDDAGAVDTYKVMCTGTDTSIDYLHDSIQDTATYATNADIIVKAETFTDGSAGTSSGSQKERFFLDVSAVTDYSASGEHALMLVDDVSRYVPMDDLAQHLFSGITLVGLYFNGGVLREGYHLIRGLVKGAVAASDEDFLIDNVRTLAYSRDPRSNPADPTETVTIVNVQKEAFPDNTPVTAIYTTHGGGEWEVLLVERCRLVRGQVVGNVSTGNPTFTIDNIVPLASGIDPREDPTNAAETITVQNTFTSSYADNANVLCIFNAGANQWEPVQRSSSAGSGELVFGKTVTTITAATGWALADAGTGTWQQLDDNGDPEGDEIEIINRYFDTIPADAAAWVQGNVLVNVGCKTFG